jgi:hypothetical protein
MTTREKALLASSPGLTVLVIGLGWWALDRLLPGAGVRLVDRLRL